MSQTWTIELDPAVEHESKRCAELKLRPPSAGEMLKALEKLDAAHSPASRAAVDAALVRAVTGVDEKLLDQLDRHVVLAASSWLNSFEPVLGPGFERDEKGTVVRSGPQPREWVLALDEVVSYGDNACAELSLRPPRQGEMQKSLAVATAAPTIRTMLLSQVMLVSLVSGQPRGVVERIPHHVVAGAATWLQGFTLASPATTTSSSPA